MPALAAATVAALLIANPSHTDADRLAANGGFLLGNAQRCGVDTDRIVRAGRMIRGLLAAASGESGDEDAAAERFTTFFLVSALADSKQEQPLASCPIVLREFTQLEGHQLVAAAPDNAAVGATGRGIRPEDGE